MPVKRKKKEKVKMCLINMLKKKIILLLYLAHRNKHVSYSFIAPNYFEGYPIFPRSET